MLKRKSTITKITQGIGIPIKGARNALELIRKGRLCAPYNTPYQVVYEDFRYKLRRYIRVSDDQHEDKRKKDRPPLILIPPLMLAAEVYDMTPELSTVSFLMDQGVDVWTVDFGAPEKIKGAMRRTLDDHILAIDHAIDTVREISGKSVHLAGYSQGGMFAYQAGAYRRSDGIASIITFGSPINWYRNLLPKVIENISGRFIGLGAKIALKPFEMWGGVSPELSSRVFKILAGKKELINLFQFFTTLHDRATLEKIERGRRFMGGEGFVAWPGPALAKFINDLVIQNRMLLGGLVINGRSVSLSDLYCPILYFVGNNDYFGRPAGVREIHKAAPYANINEVALNCGHFGMVMGSKAFGMTWPTVVDWLNWVEGQGDIPDFEPEKNQKPDSDPEGSLVDALYSYATDMLDDVWVWLGDAGTEALNVMDVLRWQLPRLAKVKTLNKNIQISISSALQEQSRAIPNETFFLWKGRAYTFAEANERVNRMVASLIACGFEPKEYVGVFMENHPEYLSVIAALNRIGAVPVLISGVLENKSFAHAHKSIAFSKVVIDAAHVDKVKDYSNDVAVYLIGEPARRYKKNIILLKDHVPEEPDKFIDEYELDQGMADDLALIVFTAGSTGPPKAVKISNRRWCSAALMTAAVCQMTTRDTIYCCLPLFHASGILVAASSALVAGSRLALAKRFSVTTFWNDIRRYGTTICYYSGQMCRYLINNPKSEHDKQNPVKIFIGNGLQKDIWKEFQKRFGIGKIIEYYSLTEGNVNLVNITGKVGSVGRPMDDPDRIRLVLYDIHKRDFEMDVLNRPIICQPNEKGLLIARVDKDRPMGHFEGYVDENLTREAILRDLFEPGDTWFSTGDLFWQDEDGDFFFADRLEDLFSCEGESVSCELIASTLIQIPFVANAAAYSIELPKKGKSKKMLQIGVAAIELMPGQSFDGIEVYKHVTDNLNPPEQPPVIRVVDRLPTTANMKYRQHTLQTQGIDPNQIEDALYIIDMENKEYVAMDSESYPEQIYQLNLQAK